MRARDSKRAMVCVRLSLLQVVLTVTQQAWTEDVEKALSEGGNKALAEYTEKCSRDLDEIVKLVRGDLSKLVRKARPAERISTI